MCDLVKGLEKSENFVKGNINANAKKLKRAFEKLKSETIMQQIKNVDEIKLSKYKLEY